MQSTQKHVYAIILHIMHWLPISQQIDPFVPSAPKWGQYIFAKIAKKLRH